MIAPELWDRLRKLDPEEAADRARVSFEEGVYRVPVLGSGVRVDPGAETFEPEDPELLKLDFFLAVSSAQYLLEAQELNLAGKLVPATKLTYGDVFFRGPHELPGDALGSAFGADAAKFRRVMGRLEGAAYDLGDLGARVHLFPRVPVWLGLWLADDEFPARVTFLFDRTADNHLPLDALWSGVMVLVNTARQLAGESSA
jgi:hypothetical protein